MTSKNVPNKNKFYSFTMAEILITLGIIGIIAAMTMPILIKNYQRREAEVRLQKAYSMLSQAFLAAQAKHGEIKDWPEWDNSETILKKYIAPELKGVKLFPKRNSYSNVLCFEGKLSNAAVDTSGNKVSAQYVWRTNILIQNPFYPNETASMKLMNGTCIGLNSNNRNAQQGGISALKMIFIDTNGSNREPNKAGYDLFFFEVVGNSIKPVDLDWAKCEDKSDSGLVCAARVMADGWKIKYW